MKHLAFLSLLTLATPVWASTSAPSNIWHADFGNGSMPKSIYASRSGQNVPVKGYYKHGFTEEGWTVEQFGFDFCAVCPTATNVDSPIDSSLSTEFFTVPEEGAILTWSARSVLPGMEESYEVIITDYAVNYPGDVLLTVTDESAQRFVTRSISLEAYRGRTISVEFKCTSADRYMLAINEISVGNSESIFAEAVNTSARFAQNATPLGGTFAVAGDLLNTGTREIPAGTVIRATTEAGDLLGSFTLSEALPSAESLSFSFPAAAPDNATTDYVVELVEADSAPVKLFESDVTRSYFVRNHFIDEGTGVWCNNCPQGALGIDELRQQFPGQMIPVCTHVNDVFANDGYWPFLKFYAVPYFMLNRERETAYSDTHKFEDYLYAPTLAGLNIRKCAVAVNGQTADIDLHVTLAEDLDNTSGRYGIGYVLTSDFYVPDGDTSFMQQNMSGRPTAMQYYFLPSVIPAKLSFYRHVSMTYEYAFEPVPGLLPGSIKAFETIDVKLPVACPELVTTIAEATLVAFVLDKETGVILNATEFAIHDMEESGIPTSPASSAGDMQGEPRYYNLQGLRINQPAPGQTVIERRGSQARKVIVR